MYNPLVRFSLKMIPGFQEMKVRYLVSQTYERGATSSNGAEKQPLLLTDYCGLEEARKHCNQLEGDAWAAIIDLQQAAHLQKLQQMAEADSPYLLYCAFIGDAAKVNARNTEQLKEAVRMFIDKETDWKPGREDVVQANLELSLGQLLLAFRYKTRKITTSLHTIEKIIGSCVTTFHSQPVSESYRITFQASKLTRS